MLPLRQANETHASIPFASKDEAYSVLGQGDEYLRVLQESFSCQIISRGNEIELSGTEEEMTHVVHLVGELIALYQQGSPITMHEVRYGIALEKSGRGASLHELFHETVLVTSRGRHIRPKTLGQRDYLRAIAKNSITFGIGPAGTGKTYLAVVMAVAALRRKEVKKLILTRPAVEAGERLGFLPGDLQEKVDPYLRPLYDALEDTLGLDLYQKFMARGVIEIAPLAYMRGRTLEDAFIILDEAQNTTAKQMKMFLTRLGFGSRMVVTGDLGQVDLPRGVTSGLRQASEILAGVAGIGMVRLSPVDVIRHEVVTRIVQAYDAYEARVQREKAHAAHETKRQTGGSSE